MAKKSKVAPEYEAEPFEDEPEPEAKPFEAEPIVPVPAPVDTPEQAARRKELRDRRQSLKEASQAPDFVPAENEEVKAINEELRKLGAEPQNDVEERLKRQVPANADKYAKK